MGGGNKEREGQGGVYDMEGKKMDVKSTTGGERRLSYPAATIDQGHFHHASTEGHKSECEGKHSGT